jgi:hypothetical protein
VLVTDGGELGGGEEVGGGELGGCGAMRVGDGVLGAAVVPLSIGAGGEPVTGARSAGARFRDLLAGTTRSCGNSTAGSSRSEPNRGIGSEAAARIGSRRSSWPRAPTDRKGDSEHGNAGEDRDP